MRVCHATLIPLDATNRHWFLRPPLTAGYLTAYADAHRPERDEHDIVDTVELAALPVAEAIAERLLRMDPEIIALSTYVWNHAEVASVCSRIRALAPRVHIVLGGPEVAFTPAQAFESFEADWVCTGEGEIPFLALLNALEQDGRNCGSLPGLLHRRDASAAVGPAVSRLDDIPSPYRAGRIRIDARTCVDLETTRGCPSRCGYCVYGRTSRSPRHFSLSRVESDAALAIARGARSIYLLAPTFNYPRKRCKDICRVIADLNGNRSVRFEAEIRAEAVDEEMADAFVRARLTRVQVGLQSVNHETLSLMGRRFGKSAFERGCRLLYERGIHNEIGIIVGLPGDDEASIRRSVDFVIENDLGEAAVFLLQVLPGSEYRRRAVELGIEYDPSPPYYVRRTPTLEEQQIRALAWELSKLTYDAKPAYDERVEQLARQSGLK